MSDYRAFLDRKSVEVPPAGLATIPELHPALMPHQADVVAWALKRGRAAAFLDTGLGKTLISLEWARHLPGDVLILAPLAVAHQTVREGERFGIPVNYCRNQAGVKPGVNITNYEMLEHFHPTTFVGVVLDESSILKSYSGKTRNQIIAAFERTPFKLACTATPAPNDHMELGNHSEFLGVMTRTEMLAHFFVHDGGDTSEWRLKGHAESEFWRWLASWAVAIRKPSDLGHQDAGYDLPALEMIEHTLPSDPQEDLGALFAMEALTLTEQRQAKRASLQARCERVAELVRAEPGEAWLIWCELNDEGDLLERLIPGAVQVAGSDSDEHKERAMLGFADGDIRVLITKPSIAGFGMNWQHAARVAFASVTHSYESFYQAIRRCWRFGQTRPVQAHVVFSEAEGAIVRNLARKQADADRMADEMVAHVADLNIGGLKATRRITDAYNPVLEMHVPAWVRAEAA